MGLMTMTRVALGLIFFVGGGLKTRRFGKEYAPDLHKTMTKEFQKAFKYLPLKEINIKMNGADFQELIAYTDMICGILLLTGQLVGLSVCILMVVSLAAAFTSYKMKYPLQLQAIPVVLCLALFSICTSRQRKDKQD